MATIGHQRIPGISLPHLTASTSTALSVASIWTAVVLASVFSPDLVSGTEQDHLPIAAITWWFWGAIATVFVLVSFVVRRRKAADENVPWGVFAAVISVIWLVATCLSIFTERQVTGSDPTQFPVAAVFAPLAAMIATGFVAAFLVGL